MEIKTTDTLSQHLDKMYTETFRRHSALVFKQQSALAALALLNQEHVEVFLVNRLHDAVYAFYRPEFNRIEIEQALIEKLQSQLGKCRMEYDK